MSEALKRISLREFKQSQELSGDTPEQVMLQKAFTAEVKGFDMEKRTVDFVISTGAVDRDRDTIDPNGWDVSHYRKNPVVLWAHDYRQLPVAKGLNVRVEDGCLKSTSQFPPLGTYPFADTVFSLIAGGFLSAVSVGFEPTEWKYVDSADRPYGVDFVKQRLLEYSIVPVPANPEALIEARAKGIDLKPVVDWAKSFLHNQRDNIPGLSVPKKSLEAITHWGEAKASEEKDMDKLEKIADTLATVAEKLSDVVTSLANSNKEIAKDASKDVPAAVKAYIDGRVEEVLKTQKEAITADEVKAKAEKEANEKLTSLVDLAVKEAITATTGKVF